MKIIKAVSSLSALAQETRLKAFRLLVRQGPGGLPAGQIAKRLSTAPATLSFHLKELEQSGLVRSWRRGRSIFYAADFDGMRRLLSFLTEDCCQGRPEICAPLTAIGPASGRGGRMPSGPAVLETAETALEKKQ